MKNTIILLLVLITFSCKAQTNLTFSLQNYDYGKKLISGSYVKDTYNDFNKFEGIWKFQDANREFIIKLRKKTHVLDDFRNIYLDLIGGEYQYFLNGIEVVNTTANFFNDSSIYANNINGHSFIRSSEFPICTDCLSTERRIKLDFSDPERPWVDAYIVLRYLNTNGVEKIIGTIYYTITLVPDDETPADLRVPSGEFTFIKQ